MTASLPLAHLNIIITRPREQADALLQRIEQAGGKPWVFPLLDVAPVPDRAALQQQLSRLSEFDLAIFISPNAVRHGLEAVGAQGWPDQLKVAAVGQGTLRALQARGVKHVLLPSTSFDSEGLLAMPELQAVSGKRVVILRGDAGRELLGDTLKERGAEVEYVTCYVRSKVAVDGDALLSVRPDALVVTSSEALGHLFAQLSQEQRAQLQGIPLFVIHERIAELGRQQGWRQVFITPSGDDGTMSGLIAWAKRNQE